MPDKLTPVYRLLLVEDDESLGFLLQDNLRSSGFLVDLFDDGLKAFTAFRNRSYDICLLDVMLPGQSGIQLAQKIRQHNQDIPLLFLSAKNQVQDRIEGLECGADDYITKPFSLKELLLRIDIHMKRAGQRSKSVQDWQAGHIIVKTSAPHMEIGDEIFTLTAKEYAILVELVKHKNTLVDREYLMNQVWQDSSFFIGRSLDVYISKLRKYVKNGGDVHIVNFHGRGYMLQELSESAS